MHSNMLPTNWRLMATASGGEAFSLPTASQPFHASAFMAPMPSSQSLGFLIDSANANEWRPQQQHYQYQQQQQPEPVGAMTAYDECSVVWAKMRGFPAWPAKLTGRTKPSAQVEVVFFGTNDSAFVPEDNVVRWYQNYADLQPRCRTRSFLAAVAEAKAVLADD